MPDDPLPTDCPACEAKIILDGDIAAQILQSTCESIERFVDSGKEFHDAHRLVVQLNKVEDEVCKFTRMVTEEMGFKGPWPKMLS